MFPTASPTALRNRIINGSMIVNQRGLATTLASATDAVNGGYTVDRWKLFRGTGAGTWRAFQETITDLPDFSQSLSLVNLNTTGTRPGWQGLAQQIEGVNVADLGWGRANAASATLSFYAKSTVAGSFGVVVSQMPGASGTNTYGALYAVPAANTWTPISLVIPPPPVGSTWDATTGSGLSIMFTFTQTGTLDTTGGHVSNGSWIAANNVWGVAGQTDMTLVNNAKFMLTGVQLEKGVSFTPFEVRPVGLELFLCQRYFEYSSGTAWMLSTSLASAAILWANSVPVGLPWQFKVTKRVLPTVTYTTTAVSSQTINVQVTRDSALFHPAQNSSGDFYLYISSITVNAEF